MEKIERRQCLSGLAGMFATSLAARHGFAAAPSDEIKAMLLHLGRNWWGWPVPDGFQSKNFDANYELARRLETDESAWRRLTARATDRGLNMIVVDINEALRFPSHPEIAVEGAWDADKMRDEVRRLRASGLEPIPKLNFSTTHSGWLGVYQNMLATRRYYSVCADIIRDVAEIFETPRFFHVGFDEESVSSQQDSNRTLGIVVRKEDLWWHDFKYIVGEVERRGMRAWMWSDRAWHHEDFFDRCPRSVLQSNWFYDEANGGFDLATNKTADRKILETFLKLDKAGFDQVPCGTNWAGWGRRKAGIGGDDIIGRLVRFSRENIASDRLRGFLMTSWKRCDKPENEKCSAQAIDLAAHAMI